MMKSGDIFYVLHIQKTRLFKYIENVSTKNCTQHCIPYVLRFSSFQIKILIFFIFLIKT